MAGVRIPDGFVDELKARIRPSDLIGRKVKLKKQGKEWVGLSPFTTEKTPSFYVNDQKQIYKCFSSGNGGDVISFVMETERLSFMDAVEKLAEDYGMPLPKATPESQEAYDRRLRLLAACEAAASFFESQLRTDIGSEARAYLTQRGLSAEAWTRHRLGYAPDDWRTTFQHLTAKGFSKAELLEAGLIVQPDGGGDPYDRFRGRVMFPIGDTRDAVIAFGGRAILPDAKPKYLNSSDTPLFHKSNVLYRYKLAREAYGDTDANGLIVCEGYMDVIALAEAGIGHAVAPLGTALTEPQLALLWRAGPEPVLCFDGDRAGLGAAYRSIERALPGLEPGRSLFFCLLEDGMDPDDVIRQHGVTAMHERLQAAIPLIELLWRRERDLEPVDTPERQAGLEQRLLKAASAIKHQGVRSAYEQELKSRLREHIWSLRAAKKPKRANRQNQTATLGETQSKNQLLRAQSGEGQSMKGRGTVILAARNPHLAERHSELLALVDFPDPDVGAIRDAILCHLEQGLQVDPDPLTTHLVDCGKLRAAELLKNFPTSSIIAQGSNEERDWLIALEHYARQEGHDVSSPVTGDALRDLDDQRLRHKRVSERRAKAMRLNEALDGSDQT
ncbi:MAG: DNA primase [Pseudomonadota bacterium]